MVTARNETVWAFVATDEDGMEDVVKLSVGGQHHNFFTLDEAHADAMRAIAQDFANLTGQSIRVVRFTAREDLELIAPAPKLRAVG